MKNVKEILDKFIKKLHLLENAVLVLALTILILLSFSQIVMRNLFSTGLFWGDAASRYLVLWVGLIGAMIATREDNHISIDIVSKFASKRLNNIIRLVTDISTAFICALLTYASIIFIRDEMTSGIKAFAGIPTWVAGIILPIAFSVIFLRYLFYFLKHLSELITDDFKTEKPEIEEKTI